MEPWTMSDFTMRVVLESIINVLIYVAKVAVTALVAGGILKLMGVL